MGARFWKLSMGKDFENVLEVLDLIRMGVVIVHKDTKPKGTSQESQGFHFMEQARDGEFFYLCHGNSEPAVI
jgi:5-methylcytosine-specific restriction enzyme B